MESIPATRTHELQAHLETQMGAQERQLAWVRLGMAVLGGLLLLVVGRGLPAMPLLLGVIAGLALYSLGVSLLLRRFPAREVGIVSAAVDMAAVTIAVYVASDAVDAYLFYGLVILGIALRFGLGASVWGAVVMSGLYVAVVLAGGSTDETVRELLPVRVAYLIGIGVIAGFFSRIVIGRATENARLQVRLAADARDRELIEERELLSRLGRDVSASLDRDVTLAAIADGAAEILGDAVLVSLVDEDERRLDAAIARGRDTALAERWLQRARGRRQRLGEGADGEAAATATTRFVSDASIGTGDVDGLRDLGLGWLLAVPILAGGRMLGVLSTAGRGSASPDDRLRRLAEAVAERAGPALENARLWSDLQQRMELERQAQRIKDDFLSIVSHELRTPLTSIQGYAQLLEARLRTDRAGESKELAHLHVIRSQSSRMRRLVDDLLDVSRIDRRGGVSIEPGDFDLAELLGEAVARTRREHPDRDVALEAPDSLQLHADRDRIDQVVSNLVENALKYSPDGGRVGIQAARRGSEIEVRISDVGVGIPAEHRDMVFERFYQADGEGRRRFGGLGLGLYISRAIVDAHGGRIWAAQNEADGRGSVFAFRLPRVAVALTAPGIAPTGEPPAFVLRRREG